MGDRHYAIQCRACDSVFEDDGLRLDCPRAHEPALLGSRYRARTFEPGSGRMGSTGTIAGCRWCASSTARGGPSRTGAID